MKSTKKLLCVLLVLVMAIGLLPLSAMAADYNKAADFSDAKDITDARVEAVDVLTALGVTQGDGDGTLKPLGTFTRAQGAVLIAKLFLGPNVWSVLPKGETGFSDIDGTGYADWAGASIKWGVDNGFIKGRGDGTFDPAAEFTTVEVAILLLKILGYGQNGEYEGTAWATNGIVDGLGYGILTLGAAATSGALREEVFQYALNALMSFLVEYNAFMGVYYKKGTNPITGADSPGPVTLGGQVFGLSLSQGVNDLGYADYTYMVGKTALVGPYLDGKAAVPGYFQFVADSTHTLRAMARIGNGYTWSTETSLWVNGSEKNNFATVNLALDSGDKTPAFPVGSLVTLYADADGVIIRVVVIYELLGVVTGVTNNVATADVYANIGDDMESYGSDPDSWKFPAGDFKENDWVLLTPKNGAIQSDTATITALYLKPVAANNTAASNPWSVAAATSTDAVASRVVLTGGTSAPITSVTAGGTVYNKFSAGRALGGDLDALSFEGDTTFYFDSNGLVIGFEPASVVAGAKSYVYVTAFVNNPGNSLLGQDAVCKASVIYTDGKKANVDLDMDKNGDFQYFNGSALATAGSLTLGTWWSYTMIDGVMRLGTLASNEIEYVKLETTSRSATIKLTDAVPNTDTVLATSRTKLTLAEDGKLANDVTGYTNFPSYTTGNTWAGAHILAIYTDASNTVLSEIHVIVEESTTAAEVIIVVKFNAVVAGGNEYQVVRDNGDTTIVLTNTISTPAIATITTTGGKTTASPVSATSATITFVDPAYLVFGGAPVILADDYLLCDAVPGGGSGRLQVGTDVDYYANGAGAIVAIIITADP